VFVAEITEVPEGAVVIFSAHGVDPAVREEAARRGLHAIDATFVQGQVIKTVPESQIVETLIEEATKLAEAAEASSPAA
jgi:4-hydroxy-3-methylbut-2-enyl diphosphate reductase IspH